MAGQHRLFALATAGLVAWLGVVRQQARGQARQRLRERRLREEIEAYAHLDARLSPDQDLPTLGRNVCLLIADKSSFQRIAFLTRDSHGILQVTGSKGMDRPILKALATWAQRITEQPQESGASATRLRSMLGRGIDVGNRSLAVVLSEQHGRTIVVPFATTGNRRLMGAIVVCANSMLSVPRSLLDEALGPLETLAIKLGRAMENVALAERLLRAEKLAGLGLLARGVAHALNNPLTSVLGYAELISENAAQPHIQEDAEIIVREAQRMRETVQSLLDLWRPSLNREEIVDMSEMVHELAAACDQKLAARGVRLVVQTGEGSPKVPGNRDRLRQVMEHLLNNAAQAIAIRSGAEHTIRIAVTHHDRSIQVIVSDTGPGFREPRRIFDPFYTTRDPGEGAGLGLSLCYGIVREHNGEITAFNLHPHGAAVMIELPLESAATISSGASISEAA